MNGVVKFLTVLLLIPALVVLGHDLYVKFGDTDEKVEKLKELDIDHKQFALSDVGWLWSRYHPESLNQAREMAGDDIWLTYITPILSQKAIFVFLAPLILLYLIYGGFWLAREGISTAQMAGKRKGMKAGKDTANSVYDRHDQNKKAKYRR